MCGFLQQLLVSSVGMTMGVDLSNSSARLCMVYIGLISVVCMDKSNNIASYVISDLYHY